MNVVCTNPDCSEYQIPKGNPADYPVEQIQCGGCGMPVVTTEDPVPEPENATEASPP